MIYLILALVLGIIVGANDAVNVFGSAIASKMLKFSRAILFFIIFVILGAIINAQYPSAIYQNIIPSYFSIDKTFVILVPVIVATLFSIKLKISSSISQSLIFSIIGFSIATGININYDIFKQLIFIWILTPFISFVLVIILQILINSCLNLLKLNIFYKDLLIRFLLILFGCLAAFALGSNLTASIVGIFSPFINSSIYINENLLFLLGSACIGLGALFFSKRIIHNIGSKVSKINSVSALAILATQTFILLFFSSKLIIDYINLKFGINLFAMPISASHVTLASILGIAVFKGFRETNIKNSLLIISSWIYLPLVVFLLSYYFALIFG
jgi:PiT family inorganic phosphate transporter|tara:strand:+ start:51 stop:1040 length:990 start_codon:yes stop_codon:yes gene_type:complete